MHYATHGSHQMQKHKFSVTCPIVHFIETTPGPPNQEKYYVDVWCPERTEKIYVKVSS
jgi:hypothetical protein